MASIDSATLSVMSLRFGAVSSILILMCLAAASGCGRSRQVTIEGEVAPGVDSKIKAEAYLFDATVEFQGKKRSVRLELYATDTKVGIGGRSYLGKGAIKGWLTADSVKLYFPTSNEFVEEPLSNIFHSLACTPSTPEVGFVDLFFGLPDITRLDSDITAEIDSSDSDRPAYTLAADQCPWNLHLVYDERSPGWRIREFSFDDGKDLQIKSKRREYKADSNVRQTKFTTAIPPGAARIIP